MRTVLEDLKALTGDTWTGSREGPRIVLLSASGIIKIGEFVATQVLDPAKANCINAAQFFVVGLRIAEWKETRVGIGARLATLTKLPWTFNEVSETTHAWETDGAKLVVNSDGQVVLGVFDPSVDVPAIMPGYHFIRGYCLGCWGINWLEEDEDGA